MMVDLVISGVSIIVVMNVTIGDVGGGGDVLVAVYCAHLYSILHQHALCYKDLWERDQIKCMSIRYRTPNRKNKNLKKQKKIRATNIKNQPFFGLQPVRAK